MAKSTKYIRLVGVKDKESILIESFLSIAQEDGFDVALDKTEKHMPKVVIVDELFHSDSLEHDFPGAEILIIGDDHNYDADDYLNRPLKWSSFQGALEKCMISSDFAVIGIEDHATTSYIPTDEDVNQSNEVDGEEEDDRGSFSHALATQMNSYIDNESSVLSESLSHTQYSYSELDTVMQDEMEIVEMAHSRIIAERTLFEGGGLALGPNIIFWENFDCLMTVKSRPVLYILSSTGSVYSEYDFLDWGLLLKSKYARVYPLPKDWSAEKKLVKYPLSWLVWFSSIARSRGYLLKSIKKGDYFMLNEWPAFDQVYNDNKHLRLCSMLSAEPHSLEQIITKTRFKTRYVVAFLNACEKQDLLMSFPSLKEAITSQKKVLPPDVLKQY